MARKIDPEIQENVDRRAENEQSSADTTVIDSNDEGNEVKNESDTIKNANAAGLGAMGRNDQRQTGYDSTQPADAGDE